MEHSNEGLGPTFTLEEAQQYASDAGFEEIQATDWLTDVLPGETSTLISVQCRKPSTIDSQSWA